MPQHDQVVGNDTGAAVRGDINNALAALFGNSSGATAPSTTVAYQFWADTTTGLLKIRNAANSAWITLGTLASANLGLLALSGGTVTGNLVLDGGTLVFNESGADLDARFEGDTDPNLLFLDASADKIGIGTTPLSAKVTVTTAATKGAGGNWNLQINDDQAFALGVGGGFTLSGKHNAGGGIAQFAAVAGIKENGTDGNQSGALVLYRSAAGVLTEGGRFDSTGHLLVAKTAINNETVVGCDLGVGGNAFFTRSGGTVLYVNRLASDGDLVALYQESALEGSISVAGNTVSYNAFLGSHWAQLAGGAHADVLPGTVMETIDEMCEWPGENNERLPKVKVSDTAGSDAVYGVHLAWDSEEFRMEQVTEDDVEEVSVVVEENGRWHRRTHRQPIKRPVFTEHPLFENGEPVMRRVKEAVVEPIFEWMRGVTADKPVRVKVGERELTPEVYEQAKHLEPVMQQRQGVNDMYVAAIGIYRVRMQARQRVRRGDLVESAGDGTARVQADATIKSSTVGKIAAKVVIETYADGSFTVPCVLMCG